MAAAAMTKVGTPADETLKGDNGDDILLGGAGDDGHCLGLAITQRVVLAHGGQIRVANRDGGGLQVTVSLPTEA